jgi:hypothetical protein
MPWSPADAFKHTKKANTPKKKRAWARIANKERRIVGDAGAIRIANKAVRRMV